MKKHIDTLILGCTHYGLVESLVQKIIGKDILIISEGRVVGKKLKEYLQHHPEIESKLQKKRQTTFYTTDATERFRRLGSSFYGKPIKPLFASY